MADTPRNPLDKPGYELVFNDDFDSPALNTANWLPLYLPQWSSRERSRPNYRIADSQLVLQITADQQPWCPEFNGAVKVSNLQTGVSAGPLGSALGQHRFSADCRVREEQAPQQLFCPQYGYIEIRCRGGRGLRNVFGFWMIGFEDTPQHSAEICPFELKGWNAGSDRATLGFGLHPFGDPTIRDEFFEREFPIDATEFHLYAVDWSPEGVAFYLDNQLIHRTPQSPAYPMQLMLNLYELPPATDRPDAQPDYPTEFAIDYVRGWRKLGG